MPGRLSLAGVAASLLAVVATAGAAVRWNAVNRQPAAWYAGPEARAVAWFRSVPIRGLRVDETTGADGPLDRRAVADPAAAPLWARFYELETNRPIFTGRDKVIRYDFNAIERERRAGDGYLGDWPADLLARDYPRWRAKNQRP